MLFEAEQEKLQARYGRRAAPTAFMVGDLVLLSYLVRPTSKLSARWAGPFRLRIRKANTTILEDMSGGCAEISGCFSFEIVSSGSRYRSSIPQAVAATDMGKVQVDMVLAHRGLVRNKRLTLEFQQYSMIKHLLYLLSNRFLSNKTQQEEYTTTIMIIKNNMRHNNKCFFGSGNVRSKIGAQSEKSHPCEL